MGNALDLLKDAADYITDTNDNSGVAKAVEHFVLMKNVECKIEHILVDAMPLNLEIESTSIIHGDALSQTIAAASVIAKVTRDEMMYELDKQYPKYEFASHKGYPTKKHLENIEKYGIIDNIYRKSYKPVKKILEGVLND